MITLDEFIQENGDVTCTCLGYNLPSTIYFHTNMDITDTQDWAAIGLIYPAMALGSDLHIEGVISKDLLYYLNNDIQTILILYDSRLKRVNVTTAGTHNNYGNNEGVAAGFSAGVDSFSTIFLHPEITHLTIFNVGALGNDADNSLFSKYIKRTENFSRDKSISSIIVDSNIDDVFKAVNIVGGLSFQKTHTIRNIAAAHVINISDYLYSSGIDYSALYIKDGDDISNFDPIIIPLLSTRKVRIHSSGSSLSRVDKIRVISQMDDAKLMLDVCVNSPVKRAKSEIPNCSRCWKCTRTLLTLDAIGKIDEFCNVFDLDRYYSRRIILILRLMMKVKTGDVNTIDALSFVKKESNIIPWYMPIFLYSFKAYLAIRSALHKILSLNNSGTRRTP